MKQFTCTCGWLFIVGKRRVFGPIWPMGLPGHFSGPSGCHHVGRMMTREDFEDQYSDCAYRFEKQMGAVA